MQPTRQKCRQRRTTQVLDAVAFAAFVVGIVCLVVLFALTAAAWIVGVR